MKDDSRSATFEDLHGSARDWICGLYAVTPDTADTSWLLHAVGEAIAGGARVVQYRNKAQDRSLRREQAGGLRELCRSRGVPLIVNDDIDLVLDSRADGVHLGKDDAPVHAARAMLGRGALIGVSCYNDLERALDAERAGASYVAFGSFYPSAVKPDAIRAPIELLVRARSALRLPIVAIGGVNAGNAMQLVAAGGHAVAVISGLFSADDPRTAAQTFGSVFATLSPVSSDRST
jgi:thiamine-phosphate pyrophosphorylase